MNVQANVMQLIWHKLFANIAINAITALLDVTNGTIAENEHERDLAEKMVREAVAVANATGCSFDVETELKNAFDVALATGTNRSSMLQDVTRKGITEIKIINGAVVKEGKAAGVPTPLQRGHCGPDPGQAGQLPPEVRHRKRTSPLPSPGRGLAV